MNNDFGGVVRVLDGKQLLDVLVSLLPTLIGVDLSDLAAVLPGEEVVRLDDRP